MNRGFMLLFLCSSEVYSLNLGIYPHRFSQKRHSLKALDYEAEIELRAAKLRQIIQEEGWLCHTAEQRKERL